MAYYHIVNSICIKKFVKEIDYPDGVDGFLFRDKNGNWLLVYWSTRENGDFFLSLPSVYDVDVTHYYGREKRR